MNLTALSPRLLLLAVLLVCFVSLGSAREATAVVICGGTCEVVGTPPPDGAGLFDFKLAILAEEGWALNINSNGSVYVYGAIVATTTITLNAGNEIVFDAVLPGFTSSADTLITSLSDTGPTSTDFFNSGDIYLDLSGIGLYSLSILAADNIITSSDVPVQFTPEPGTGTLFGMGIAAMAIRRSGKRGGQ